MFGSMVGHTTVVTGATKGIGKGIASVFARAGANVLITGRSQEDGEQACQELNALGGGQCLSFVGDVANRESCQHMAEAALNAFGGIDVLCANAGIYPGNKLIELTPAEIDQVFDTNVKGTIFAVQACQPALACSGRGRIIMTSSITGPITGFPGWAHYGASKAAQLGFMRSAALELASSGITVNAILPGTILTEGLSELGDDFLRESAKSIPLQRLGSVDDIGYAALFLASKAAGYITGQTLVIDGGQVLPESPAAMDAI